MHWPVRRKQWVIVGIKVDVNSWTSYRENMKGSVMECKLMMEKRNKINPERRMAEFVEVGQPRSSR